MWYRVAEGEGVGLGTVAWHDVGDVGTTPLQESPCNGDQGGSSSSYKVLLVWVMVCSVDVGMVSTAGAVRTAVPSSNVQGSMLQVFDGLHNNSHHGDCKPYTQYHSSQGQPR